MKPLLGLLALGVTAHVVQGVLAGALPLLLCPDLPLLFVVAVALAWRRTASGLVLASGMGYVTDVLAGSLLGLHALLRVGVFVATLLPSHHFSLRGFLPLALFTALLTVGNALAVASLTAFVGGGGAPATLASGLALQALVNALAAPLVLRGVQRLVGALDAEESGRRLLRFDTRTFPA